jgi:hypothetical protein
MGGEKYFYGMGRFYDVQYMQTDVSLVMEQQINPGGQLTFA